MRNILNYYDIVPQIVPQKMNGTKLTYKVCIKSDHTRNDGTNALFINLYLNGKRKRLPLNIAVPEKFFDKSKQRIIKNYVYKDDYNLLIEKVLSDLNTIEVNYRLNNETPTLEQVVEDLLNPSLRLNFNTFAVNYLEKTKDNLKKSTYLQQKGILRKIETFKDPIPFNIIDEQFLNDVRNHFKKQGNKPITVESTVKSFKKFLHAANEAGIKTSLKFNDISVKRYGGNFTFLMPNELKIFYDFYKSPFINKGWKCILQRYLFSCFTGLRISDIEQLTLDNFLNGYLIFSASKTNKFARIKLNKTALELVSFPEIFEGTYSREHINQELKKIATACGINKRVYFHSSRHTFATNYLMRGGRIQNLQKLLGHSDIKTTMVYEHVVESVLDDEIVLMDGIVN